MTLPYQGPKPSIMSHIIPKKLSGELAAKIIHFGRDFGKKQLYLHYKTNQTRMEIEIIQNKIYEVRGRRVMLDFDLAALYQVETRTLKQAVRRNIERFPDDFLLRLSSEEANDLILMGVSQIVIPPGYNIGASQMFAFTEMGVSMLSSVLRSERAIQMNIAVMRAFVAMRACITSNATIAAELSGIRTKLELLERNDELLARTDEENLRAFNDTSEDLREDIDNLYLAIAELSVKTPQIEKPRTPIGFRTSANDM